MITGLLLSVFTAAGIVGLLCLIFDWHIAVGIAASGAAIALWLIFCIKALVTNKYRRKARAAQFLTEIVLTILAVCLTALIGKYDFSHSFALVAPCLTFAFWLVWGISQSIDNNRRKKEYQKNKNRHNNKHYSRHRH